ncbi:MAG: ABC transporter permease [Gemmatimonadota bacterium]|nr:ABC transporter permease [Gemmatimonadota bacterium]
MIRVVFMRNLRHRARLLLALSLGLGVAELLFIQVAGALESGPGLQGVVRMMPPAIQSVFGQQLTLASFGAAVAFGFQHPAILMAALAFVVVACTIPPAERETGVMELILARPIPRAHYLLGAFATAVVGAVMIPAALLTACVVGLAIVDAPGQLSWDRYVMSAVGMTALLLAFAGIALMLGARAARRGVAVPRTVGLILTLYLVDVFAERLAWLGWLRWASPFHYFRPIRSAVFGETPIEHLIVLVAVCALMTTVAFVRFGRGDTSGGRW